MATRHFTSAELGELARKVDMSEAALLRILGVLTIRTFFPLTKKSPVSQKAKAVRQDMSLELDNLAMSPGNLDSGGLDSQYQIGLQLDGLDLMAQSHCAIHRHGALTSERAMAVCDECKELRKTVLDSVVSAIRDYQKLCPVVVNWIRRGDFSPSRPPPNLERFNIIHASRSAGRLRANLIRSLEARNLS